MKRLAGRVSVVLVVGLAIGGAVFVGGLVKTVEIFAPPSYSLSLATVQSVSASAWLIFDIETGVVLYHHNERSVLPIASLTKLATAKQVHTSDLLYATTTVGWVDVVTEGRAGRLSTGDVYTRHTLLFPLLLESSNDAASALARSDDTLLAAMNEYAAERGLQGTSFTDASGLSAENVGSALDLRTLLRDVYHENRHLIDISSLTSYYHSQNAWLNNSPFINDEGYVGGKHGYLPEANRTAAVIFDESLQKGGQRRIGYVVLGSADLAYDINLLRDHIKNNVTWQ